MRRGPYFHIVSLLAVLGTSVCADTPGTLEALGERLFFDVNLSANRTQSCASCHDPDTAFIDPRGMASPGDDGVSLGDRNAPTAMYAAMTPVFHMSEDGQWTGGLFLDGRAATLADQAGGPPLNPIEMGMKTKADVTARLRENPDYEAAFSILFSKDALHDPDTGYSAMTQAIAAFERTEVFNPFSSKYDRYLRGAATLTDLEELGRHLFFSTDDTNCSLCHQATPSAIDPKELFTDHMFHNTGIPENKALRAKNGVPLGTIDEGLAANPDVSGNRKQRSKFRTPTLRNVAVTGPYMHNGMFADLRTVILFYNRYNTLDATRRISPETGKPFGMMQVPNTLAVKELTHGPALTDGQIDALVAFLKTLTDERYTNLLKQ